MYVTTLPRTVEHTTNTTTLQTVLWTAVHTPCLSRAPCIALQGVFRGLQDTRSPLAATMASNTINIILAPLLIFGVSRALQQKNSGGKHLVYSTRGSRASAGAPMVATTVSTAINIILAPLIMFGVSHAQG